MTWSFLSDDQADTSWGNQIFILPDVYLDFSERGLVNSYEDLYDIQEKKIHIMSITYIMITTATCTLGWSAYFLLIKKNFF